MTSKRIAANRFAANGVLHDRGWALDFAHVVFRGGRSICALIVIDEFNRGVLTIEVGFSIPTAHLIQTLNHVIASRGVPASIRLDNGPEMMSRDFTCWAVANGIELNCVARVSPNPNAYVGRFARTYGREVLGACEFENIEEIQRITEDWVRTYNTQRTGAAPSGRSPTRFLQRPTLSATLVVDSPSMPRRERTDGHDTARSAI